MSDPYGPPYDPNRGYQDRGGYPGPSSGGPYGGYPDPSSGAGSGYGGDYGRDYPPQQSQSPWGPPGGGYRDDRYSGQGYGNDGHGSYPDQGYQAPYQTYPTPYSAPPAKKKSKTPLVLGIIAAVLVVLCGGGVAAVAVFGKDSKVNADPATGTSTGPSTAATSAAPVVKVAFAAPDKIGVLRKSPDQSKAAGIKADMASSGLENPFAVLYDDTTVKGRVAVAWGGTGAVFGTDAQTQIDGFFKSAANSLDGGTLGTRQTVSPGAVGGLAQCAKVDGTGVVMVACVWAGDNALLGFLISGLTVDKAGDRMRSMLAAIVTKS